MKCPEGAEDGEAGEGETGGATGSEIDGDKAGDPEDTQAMVSGIGLAGGAEGTGGGAGGIADRPGDTHATVSGIALAAGRGRGGGAGVPEGAFSGAPHFSQNFDDAAFCAPHSSQNRTDSEAMTGSEPCGL